MQVLNRSDIARQQVLETIPLAKKMERVSSPDKNKCVLLDYDGEARFGPAFFVGKSPGFELRIQRDLAGLESARQLSGGVTVSWERDLLGRPLTRRTLRALPGAGVVETGASAYHWRGEDQIAAIIDAQRGPRVFEHDRRGRLIREARPDAVVERAMDAVGNIYRTRDGHDRRYQKGGTLERDGATRYAHDEDGNRVAKIEPDGKTWRYHWNGAGMLREVERPDGSRVRYQYDALARRTQKQRVSLAEDGSETIEAQTDFVWDGHTLVHELDQEQGLTTWVWEPGTFTPVAKLHGERHFSIASDHLGTPSEMYDELGQLAWKMQLDVFGVPQIEAGERGDCPLRWPGQYEDAGDGAVLQSVSVLRSGGGAVCSAGSGRACGWLPHYRSCRRPATLGRPTRTLSRKHAGECAGSTR